MIADADHTTCDALVAIDVQHVFADPGSPWGSPMYAAARPEILTRVAAYGDRAVLTRFVAPTQPTGAWRAYYDQWPFALVAPDDPLYTLVPELEGRATLDLETFGKWGPELAAALGDARSVEVIGLATDCCVISTVLAMADAGLAVTVPAAACGGSTPENHERALALMELYAPLVTVVGP
ncbi:isochorismatase family protein [Lapillicoccus sp.]|uniref:cysteine hydrolase family protein n=1 Tax=Lapillicoccus sp. TaxID=1909287 RepID=UPI0025DF07C5|nr:isochorismatase family protein [Lapillicoccus sp.]